jgi:hypothetical protein
MIAIKLQCGCGQKYAFDVEPIGGRLPGAVACPICGADGTPAANAILAERVPAQPIMAIPVAAPRVAVPVAAAGAQPAIAAPAAQRVAAAAVVASSSPRVAAVAAPVTAAPAAPMERKRLPGQMDPETAKNEARSKIMWGDDPADVQKFLMAHGFSSEEAKAAVTPILEERKQSVRKAGVHKIFTGIGMMFVPVIAAVVFLSVGFFPIKIFGLCVAIGVWGAFRILSGIIMYLSPKSEKGDVSEM